MDTFADALDEGDQSLHPAPVQCTGAVFAGGARACARPAFLLDDDGDVRAPLAVKDVEVVERNGGRAGRGVRDRTLAPLRRRHHHPLRDSGNSATAGEDFTARSGTVDFAAGQTDASVSVAVSADTDVEATEAFDLVLDTTGLDLANGAAGAVGTATILDDDAGSASLPVLSVLSADVVESANSRPDIEFTLALSAPAPTDVTYTARSLTARPPKGGISSRS